MLLIGITSKYMTGLCYAVSILSIPYYHKRAPAMEKSFSWWR